MFKLSEHKIYYLSLIVILALGFFLANSSSDRGFQIGVTIATTFFYVLWGILHHLVNHDLHPKIVIEYMLIGTFGLAIIFFLLRASGNF